MKYQPNIPTDLYNNFIENLGYTPENENVLVIRDIYTACYLSINNEVTFVSDDSEAISMFVNTVIVNSEFSSNNKYIFVEENNEKKWLSTINEINNNLPINKETGKKMKFTVAIMNPPYDGNLHLKILEKVIPIADKVVNISPARWLQDPLAKYKKNSDYNKFENSISKKIENIKIIPAVQSNKIFNISFGDMAITLIGDGGFDYSRFNNNDFVNKIVNKCSLSIMDRSTKEGSKVAILPKYFGIINSHLGDTTRWISDNFALFTTYRETYVNKLIQFETQAEVINCFNYLNSTVMRYYAIQARENQRVPWQFVPYLDFTKQWTNKSLCEYFEITGYIDDEHAESNSDWEIILKTMEQYK